MANKSENKYTRSDFRITRNNVLGDYINAWNPHWSAHEEIKIITAKGLVAFSQDLALIKQPIQRYKQYISNKYPTRLKQLLEESDSAVVEKINALVELFNQELKQGHQDKEVFLKYYNAVKVLMGK